MTPCDSLPIALNAATDKSNDPLEAQAKQNEREDISWRFGTRGRESRLTGTLISNNSGYCSTSSSVGNVNSSSTIRSTVILQRKFSNQLQIRFGRSHCLITHHININSNNVSWIRIDLATSSSYSSLYENIMMNELSKAKQSEEHVRV